MAGASAVGFFALSWLKVGFEIVRIRAKRQLKRAATAKNLRRETRAREEACSQQCPPYGRTLFRRRKTVREHQSESDKQRDSGAQYERQLRPGHLNFSFHICPPKIGSFSALDKASHTPHAIQMAALNLVRCFVAGRFLVLH
jgi:hypothetical protein